MANFFDPTVAKHEREHTGSAVVPLCLPNGRVNPNAVAWSRRPHVRANLRWWGRRKRFEYWCITTPELVFAFSVSHSDYRKGLAVFFLDLATGEEVNDGEAHWLPGAVDLPEDLEGPIVRTGDRARVSITTSDEGPVIELESPRVRASLQVLEPAGHESMGVVVPWSPRRFQYTRKDNGLRVRGWVEVDGRRREVRAEDAWAALDQGRGKWPYEVLWNWGSGAGITDGHEIGIQLGAKWTDGSPSTENALRFDGRVEKLSHDVEWVYDTNDFLKPWSFHGPRVDLTFTPVHNRHSELSALFVRSREDQAFGWWNGTVVSESGRDYRVEQVFGWAEEVYRRW